MRLLAIDTTEEACSAALYLESGLTGRYAVAPRQHSELILAMMDELLTDAHLRPVDLDALAFARGPGSFTGVRIAAAVAQGVALAANLPVVPVSSLQALAQGACRQFGADRVLAAFDARMNEVYWGCFVQRHGLASPLGAELVVSPQAVPDAGTGPWTGVGSGWQSYADVLSGRFGGAISAIHPEMQCDAQDVAVLAVAAWREGAAVPAEQALPVYLRDQVAAKRRARP